MSKYYFSIITVCLNSEKTIRRTIRSLKKQAFEDFEFILVDGKSNDNTLKIAEEELSTASFNSSIISEEDTGIYDAMNKGILNAQGQYIGILNSDDWYESETLQTVYDSSKNDTSNNTIYYGLINTVSGNQNISIVGIYHSQLIRCNISHPGSFVPKSVHDRVGLYDLNFKIAADYEFMLRAYLSEVNFYMIHKILANFDLGGISNKNHYKSIKDVVDIRHKYNYLDTKRYIYGYLRVFIAFLKSRVI